MSKQHRSWLVVAAITALVVFLGMRALETTTQGQENSAAPSKPIWQRVETAGEPSRLNTYRTKVPGGWLVLVHHEEMRGQRNGQGYGYGAGVGSGVTFVPDPEHTWRVP